MGEITLKADLPKFEDYTPTGRVERANKGVFILDVDNRIRRWSGRESNGHYITYTKNRWRARIGLNYWCIFVDTGKPTVIHTRESGVGVDNGRYACGNYFQTKEEAEVKLAKFKEILQERD